MNKRLTTVFLFLLITGLALAQQKNTKSSKKNHESVAKDKVVKVEAKKDSMVFANDKVVQRDSVRAVKVKGFQSPEFPGGKDKLSEFLDQNMKYPEQAKKEKVEGDVFVRFMVKKDGTIVTPKVISGLGAGCDQEAVRLLSVMPKWTPGTKDDEPVDMPYTMYIHFVLD